MKTYWLLGKEPVESSNAHCPFSSILLGELSKVKGGDDVFAATKRKNLKEHGSEHHDDRSLYMYSPVSFDDVKRSKSCNMTPTDSPLKQNVNSQDQKVKECPQENKLGSTNVCNNHVTLTLGSENTSQIHRIQNTIQFEAEVIKHPHLTNSLSRTCLIL